MSDSRVWLETKGSASQHNSDDLSRASCELRRRRPLIFIQLKASSRSGSLQRFQLAELRFAAPSALSFLFVSRAPVCTTNVKFQIHRRVLKAF